MIGLIYDQSKNWIPLTESIVRGLHSELMQFDKKAKKPIGSYKTLPDSVTEQNHRTGEKKSFLKQRIPVFKQNYQWVNL